MCKMKLLAMTAIAIFVAGALTSVAAQIVKSTAIPIVGTPLNGTYTIAITANELSPGVTEFALGKTYGWTAYGKTSGDLTGFIFVSMNYTLPNLKVTSGVDISPLQPILPTSEITGGSWSKLIFNRGQYLGSVYGRIGGGTLTWSQSDLSATMSLVLTADNGTGSFVGNVGKGSFEGTMNPSLTTKGGNVTGVLTLNY